MSTGSIVVGRRYISEHGIRVVVLARFDSEGELWIAYRYADGKQPSVIRANVFLDSFETPGHSLKRGNLFILDTCPDRVFLYISDEKIFRINQANSGVWKSTEGTLQEFLFYAQSTSENIERVDNIDLDLG